MDRNSPLALLDSAPSGTLTDISETVLSALNTVLEADRANPTLAEVLENELSISDGGAPSITLTKTSLEKLRKALRYSYRTETQLEQPAAALLHQALYLFLDQDRLDLAFPCFRRAVLAEPKLSEAYYSLGVCYSALFDTSYNPTHCTVAIELLKLAFELDPTFGAAALELGKVLHALDPAAAKQAWEIALQAQPELAEAHLNIANSQMWDEQDTDAALRSFERALELEPDWLEAYDFTNFYQVYLRGEYNARVEEHIADRPRRKRERAHVHGLDQFPLRIVSGIAPYIGHYSYLDDLVKGQLLGILPRFQLAVLAPEKEIVNPALLECFKPYISVLSDPLVIEQLNPLTKFLEFSVWDVEGLSETFNSDSFAFANFIQDRWQTEERPPVLQISAKLHEFGWRTLESLGIPRGAWFVALHVRDDGFKGPDSYHSLRNADIDSFVPMAEEIVRRGGWVIRMGDAKMKPFPETKGVIDYARSEAKSQKMDVFLWAKSRFFVGGNSGPSWLPHMFGVPVVRVNWTPITRVPWSQNDLLIPKLFRSTRDNRMLSFTDMINPRGEIDWVHSSEALSERDIQPISNSPEELRDVVTEMLERIEGRISYSAAENALQEELQKIIRAHCPAQQRGDRTSRIGSAFLNQHRNIFR